MILDPEYSARQDSSRAFVGPGGVGVIPYDEGRNGAGAGEGEDPAGLGQSGLRQGEGYQGQSDAGFGGALTDDFGEASDVSGVGTYTAGRRAGGKTGGRLVVAESEAATSITGEKFKKRRKRKQRERPAAQALRDQKDLYVDYEAMVEDRANNGGQLQGLEVDDPDKFWELVVPDEEQEARDLNYVGPLSYRKVKRHQFVNHPRDRVKRKEFEFWNSEMSYIPLYLSSIKRS